MTTLLPEKLTERQRQVAGFYADTNLSPQQIGERLGISAGTVMNTAYQVYRLLRVHSRPALRSVMLTFELAPAGGGR